MKSGRDVRRCALQELYQRDSGGVERDLLGSFGPEGERRADDTAARAGAELAAAAWAARSEADAEISRYTTEWPIHRQPVVDRNVLRLAWWEMRRGGIPPALAINEAIELAREFGTDRSPSFVNAVLDRVRVELGGA